MIDQSVLSYCVSKIVHIQTYAHTYIVIFGKQYLYMRSSCLLSEIKSQNILTILAENTFPRGEFISTNQKSKSEVDFYTVLSLTAITQFYVEVSKVLF